MNILRLVKKELLHYLFDSQILFEPTPALSADNVEVQVIILSGLAPAQTIEKNQISFPI